MTNETEDALLRYTEDHMSRLATDRWIQETLRAPTEEKVKELARIVHSYENRLCRLKLAVASMQDPSIGYKISRIVFAMLVV
jgi:hypothetical protein